MANNGRRLSGSEIAFSFLSDCLALTTFQSLFGRRFASSNRRSHMRLCYVVLVAPLVATRQTDTIHATPKNMGHTIWAKSLAQFICELMWAGVPTFGHSLTWRTLYTIQCRYCHCDESHIDHLYGYLYIYSEVKEKNELSFCIAEAAEHHLESKMMKNVGQ